MKKNSVYDAAARERRLRQSENKLRAQMGKFIISKRHERRKQEEGMFSLKNLLSQSSARSEGIQQGIEQGYDDAIKKHAPEVALKIQEVRDKAEQDKQVAVKAAEEAAKQAKTNKDMENEVLAKRVPRVQLFGDNTTSLDKDAFINQYNITSNSIEEVQLTFYDKDGKIISHHATRLRGLWDRLRKADAVAAHKITAEIEGRKNPIQFKSLEKEYQNLGKFVDAEPGRVVVHKPPATPTKSVKIEEIKTPEPAKAKTPATKSTVEEVKTPEPPKAKTPPRRRKSEVISTEKPTRSPSPPPSRSSYKKTQEEVDHAAAIKMAKEAAISIPLIAGYATVGALSHIGNKLIDNASKLYNHLKHPTATKEPLRITDDVKETRDFVDGFKGVEWPEEIKEITADTVKDIQNVLKPTDEVIVTQNNSYYPVLVEDLSDTIRVIANLSESDIVITNKNGSLSKIIPYSPQKQTTSTQTPSDNKTKGNDSDDAEKNKPDDQINPLGLKPKELIKVIADRNSKDFGQVFRSLSGSEPIGEKTAHDYLNSLRTRGVQIQWVDDKGTRHRVPKEYTGHPLRYVMRDKNVQRIVLHTKNGEVDLTKVANAPHQRDD
jgi:hypothetical protein